MPLRRRAQNSLAMGIWPGFVDAMSAMLLVFTFVLSIFMITQYFLRDTILGQEAAITNKDAALSSLNQRLNALSDVLSLEREERSEAEQQAERLRASLLETESREAAALTRIDSLALDIDTLGTSLDAEREAALREAAERRALEALASTLREDLSAVETSLAERTEALSEEESRRALEAAAAESLRKRLTESTAELTAMELVLDAQRAEAEDTLTLLAGALAAEEALGEILTDREGTLSEREALLAVAESELAKASEATLEEQRQVALLNEQVRALRDQLASVSDQLDTSNAERETLAGVAEERESEVANLGQRLNTALAERARALGERNDALEEVQRVLKEQVDELEDFRSEFFGRVRAAIGDREDIVVQGDRFVFQSEVLFEAGSADLGDAGRRELSKFARILNEIIVDIPPELNWILRIDGHTDRRGLAPGRTPYRNNWELSQARALSVAEFLISAENVPPQRLAPTGFGEFQPLRLGNNAEAYAQNRRIELKLTER